MKRFTVLFTLRAERQLDDLYSYIALRSGQARADRFTGGIVDDCLALADFPERGTKRDDIRPNLRTKGYARRVTIAFSIDSDAKLVVVHGVFYGGQDYEPALRDEKK